MTDDATDDGWICRSCGQWFLTWPADSEACPGPRKGAQEPTGTSRDLEGAQQPAGAAHELAAPHDAEPVHPVWGYGPAYEKLEPTHGDLNVTHTGRFLDPVRAAALHEAVQHEAHRMRPPPDDEAIGRVIAAAKMFEAWLEGPKRFDAYLAEDETP